MSTRGASTRERLVETATFLLWQHGYGSVGVEAICRAAGLQKGSFYHAFRSKEALVVAAIERIWSINRQEIAQIYEAEAPITERFRQHLEWMGQSQRRLKARYGFVPGTFDMALNIGVPPAVSEVNRRASGEHNAMLLRAISQILEETGHSVEAAPWLTSVVQRLIAGSTAEARFTNSLAPFEALPETILALLRLGPPPVTGAGEALLPQIWPTAARST